MSLLSAQNLLRGKTTFCCSNYCFPLQTSNWRSMLHFKTHWFTISLAFLLKCFLSRVYFYFILKSPRSGSWIFTSSWEGTGNLKEEDTHQKREKERDANKIQEGGKGEQRNGASERRLEHVQGQRCPPHSLPTPALWLVTGLMHPLPEECTYSLGLARKFIWVFLSDVTGKSGWTFWLIQ